MEGIVDWFNAKKRFGFVTGENGEKYFLHLSAIPKGTFVREGDKVSFEAVETDKGKQAQNIQLLQKASDIGGGQKSNKPKQEENIDNSENFDLEPSEEF